MQLDEEIRREAAAVSAFDAFISDNKDLMRYIAHWGDGRGGYVANRVCEIVGIDYFDRGPSTTTKRKISRKLAKRVFERDAYRCVTCGDYHSLECDHIIPESTGGPTTFDNLQTMCKTCNGHKGARCE